MEIDCNIPIRTVRLKVKTEAYSWLNAAAIEVNQVWNYANATSYKAGRPFSGPSKWLTAFELDKLTAGATAYFDRIGSETIQRINAEFTTRRARATIGRTSLHLTQTTRLLSAIRSIGILLLSVAYFPALAADLGKSQPVKIAVFDFELEDVSAAASLLGKTTSTAATMEKVSSEARRVLAQSGRYSLIDVSKANAKAVTEKSLRDCDGCDSGIALQLGAEQSLIGVVRRVSMTDYYVLVQISDCRTGKVLNQQEANFAGGDDGWASGVRMLIKHQILVSAD
jgi:hypothetical protein